MARDVRTLSFATFGDQFCSEQQVRLVSMKAERPNLPSRSHARQGGGWWWRESALWGVSPVVVGGGGGVLYDDTYITPLG